MTKLESSDRLTEMALPQDRVKTPRFGHLQQDANPQLAIHLLQEIHQLTLNWQSKLTAVNAQIVELSASGPTLAAWLESRSFKTNVLGQPIPTPYTQVDPHHPEPIDPDANYRLCGLDEKGELWMRPCPLSEILAVSMAIARYQQLRDLTQKRHQLETKVRQVLETLVHLRMELEDPMAADAIVQ
jgi:hypothetical protein